jgi:hypothetical protein
VVDQVRCAIEIQDGMVMRNAGLPPERPIEFRFGIPLGDVVEESIPVQRNRLPDHLDDNPSLRPLLPRLLIGTSNTRCSRSNAH